MRLRILLAATGFIILSIIRYLCETYVLDDNKFYIMMCYPVWILFYGAYITYAVIKILESKKH